MKQWTLEVIVGVFVVMGVAAMVYISVSLGELELLRSGGYKLKAQFTNTSGLKENASVEVAGVNVGKVESIRLNNYLSTITLRINPGVELPEDTIASIRTQGIIGEKFVRLSPGGSDVMLRDGDVITDTESAIDIEELISRYIFSQE